MSVVAAQSLLDERLQGLAQLDRRSQDIFRRLVETYLDTGEPVGLAHHFAHPAGHAVARLGAQCDDGSRGIGPHRCPAYECRTHSDPGRPPALRRRALEVGSISPEERARIDTQMAAANRPRRIDEVLGEATTLLSGLSHCAGVVVAPKLNARLKHIEFVSLGPGTGPRHPCRRGRHGREPRHRRAGRPAALDARPRLELSLGASSGEDHRRVPAQHAR